MKTETDSIIVLDDETPNVYRVMSMKFGKLGIIFIPDTYNKFVFRQTATTKYLKAFHLLSIVSELNIKNGVNRHARNER